MDDADPGAGACCSRRVKRGFDYVDVEHRSGFLDVMAEKAGKGLVVSYHDLEGTPDDLDGLYADDVRAGRRHREDRRSRPARSPTWGACSTFAARAVAGGRARRSSPSPWVRWACSPASWPAATARPSPSPPPPPGPEAAPGQLPAAQMADLYRVRGVTPDHARSTASSGRDVARSLSPVAPQPRLRGARPRRGLRAPPGGSPRRLPRRPARARPVRLQRDPALQGRDPAAPRRGRRGGGRLAGSVNTVVVRDGLLCAAPPPTASACSRPCGSGSRSKGRERGDPGRGRRGPRRRLRPAHARARAVTLLARDPSKAAEVARAVGCGYGALRPRAATPGTS